MASLREYQQQDVSKLRDTLRQGAKRVLFEASVGYGKSVVIETLAHAYVGAGHDVLALSNRRAVVDQLRKRARGSERIQVMTVQAADRRRDALGQPRLVLVDEFHMGGSGTQYARVIDACPGAIVIGFTGTPRPESFDALPAHVQGKSAAWLTDHGWLAPLRYRLPSRVDLSGVRKARGDYVESDLADAVEKSEILGSVLDTYRGFCVDQPTLLFGVNIKHIENIQAEFQAAGIDAETLTGKHSATETERRIDHLTDGGLLLTVDRVSAGFDLPELPHIISVRPTLSEQLWVQQLGRVARAAEGKEWGMVHDHCRNSEQCGTLTEARDWRNPREGEEDRKTESGERLDLRTCGNCDNAYSSSSDPICPYCGNDNGQDLRISVREAVELREKRAEEIEAEREAEKQRRAAQRKHLGMGIKQRAAMLRNKRVQKPWEVAVDQMRDRLDRALREGDDVAERFARGELRAAGVRS
ncbi:DEAD/DEAH box helicase [Sagittula sp. MA-2]|jgi:superfamily II DNA or RNA helicase|uniref:DEAD/DEAH box helicase n=1 Tax=Sagittula sp. MA-2 TaxID=3048007 RepID=UPI0024C233BA|nr:DEAD/DEAH box helicase family protein [Sagittula sp. MA-2]WHZ36530.1 DEAD/DEAH box helicase family protein [Sagittula sp. MA-2]